MEIILAIPFGLVIGVVVATVGGGGAILALPVLVYVLGEGVSPASTASLIVVALGASVGAGSQALHGQLCWRVAATFSVPAAAGAYLGTLASGSVSGRTLILAFVPVMLIAAVVTYRRGEAAAEEDESADCPRPGLVPASSAGLAVGALTGFFGVGGGFLIVPALTVALALPLRRAIATSLAIITLTGLAALISHLTNGAEPDWPLTLVLCGCAAVGALAGSAVGRRLPARTLARAFGVVVALVALFLLVDVLLLGGPPVG
ncbi:MAG: sulfite exporter TauE/SafE family protein [Solirubrobacterales bacterium]|nr:sulfite exporter TauE/SafE family protein [Solirubrobacterales bacterium]